MTSGVKDPPRQPNTTGDAKGKDPPASPSNVTAQKRLLWTPTEGEDATKALFPLTRHVRAEIHCGCGTDLLVCWRARTGLIMGHHFVRCPNCHREHRTPDEPLRLFRRDGDSLSQVPLE